MRTRFDREHMKDNTTNSHEAGRGIGVACWSEGVLVSKLHRLLLKLSSDRRRETLKSRFSEAQRLKLEHWILAQKQSQKKSKRPRSHLEGIAQERPLNEKTRSAEGKITKKQRHHSCSDLAKLRRVPGMIRNPQSNGCYYIANVAINNIHLLSRADRNMRLVEKYHAALLEIRQRAISCHRSGFKASFRRSVFDTLEEYCLDPSDMGLRFFISFRPLWEPRPLCTGVYHITELDVGLQAWQRLTDAHKMVRRQLQGRHSNVVPPEDLVRAWQCFHDTYLDIMADNGYSTDAIRERLNALEVRQFARQEQRVQAWNRSQMMRQERQQAIAARRQKRLAAQETRLRLRKRAQDGRAERNIVKLLLTWGKMRRRDELLSRRK